MEQLIIYKTDKKRYTVRPINWAGVCNEKGQINEHLNHLAIFTEKEEAEKFVEWKREEEQNRLLKLPVAIGDIVYWLCGTEILPMVIEYFVILPNKIKFSFKYYGGGERLKNFTKYMYDDDIGKCVFFTEFEATAALQSFLRK